MEKARKTPAAQISRELPGTTDMPEVFNLRVSRNRGLLFGVVAVVTLMSIGAGAFWLGLNLPQARAAAIPVPVAAEKLPAASGTHLVAEGPWGDMEYQLTVLEPPEECLLLSKKSPVQPSWFFKQCSPDEVRQILVESGVSQAEQKLLCVTNQWRAVPDGIVITPAWASVMALSSDARRKLYGYLGQFSENSAQHEPFYWSKAQEEKLFTNAPRVFAAARDLVKRLSYSHGGLVLFADLPAVMCQIRTQPERIALEKALSSQMAVFLKLNITPESDIDSLMRYWGVGGCGKYAEPGLGALSRLPEGRKASIFSVLPPFAREHLYVFPSATDPGPQDGMWTAFNFLKDRPDPPTSDGNFWRRKLDSEYYPVFSDPRFGDIVLLTSPSGSVVQVCVYLADNLVFAKTSARISTPWSILRLSDVETAASVVLPEDVAPQVSYYRSKSV